MKIALTVGVFDLLHYGHFELFRRGKEMVGADGKLLVAVQDDDAVAKYKPRTRLVYDWATRAKMIGALRYVDDVVHYRDIDKSISEFEFDIFIVGEDQKHPGFVRAVEWCKAHGKDVVVLPQTQGISASMLRKVVW